ncbi:hypothetical protein JST97_06195 [bacterium]|nr:hypothetical protein [bacterium]
MKALLLLLLAAGTALAQPTCSGTLKAVKSDTIEVEDSAGHRWTGHLRPDCQNLTGAPLSRLRGQNLVYRVRGALGPDREIELVGKWTDSTSYQCPGVNQPYYTRRGDMVGPGGVGGTPDNGPNLAKIRNVGAGAPMGAFPHQNMP